MITTTGESEIEELRRLVRAHAGQPSPPVAGEGGATLARLRLVRFDQPSVPAPAIYEPVFCLAVQGAKRLLLGERDYVYDRSRFLVVAVDLPVMGAVIEASEDEPFLCIVLRLSRLAIVDILANLPAVETADRSVGIVGGPTGPDLLDPVLRLVRLSGRPQEAVVLAPLYEREILYRLLAGPAGAVLRQMVKGDSRLGRIDRAIDWIKRHYNEPMRIERLAEVAGMSQASLHRHFRAVTSMSPLQFQKQMRLQEARRRLVAERLDAGSVGFSVGYESQSQFSREYARLFGAPPARDAARLRGIAMTPERAARQ